MMVKEIIPKNGPTIQVREICLFTQKNGGALNWMVYNGKSLYKWMRTGGTPILGSLQITDSGGF